MPSKLRATSTLGCWVIFARRLIVPSRNWWTIIAFGGRPSDSTRPWIQADALFDLAVGDLALGMTGHPALADVPLRVDAAEGELAFKRAEQREEAAAG